MGIRTNKKVGVDKGESEGTEVGREVKRQPGTTLCTAFARNLNFILRIKESPWNIFRK